MWLYIWQYILFLLQKRGIEEDTFFVQMSWHKTWYLAIKFDFKKHSITLHLKKSHIFNTTTSIFLVTILPLHSSIIIAYSLTPDSCISILPSRRIFSSPFRATRIILASWAPNRSHKGRMHLILTRYLESYKDCYMIYYKAHSQNLANCESNHNSMVQYTALSQLG